MSQASDSAPDPEFTQLISEMFVHFLDRSHLEADFSHSFTANYATFAAAGEWYYRASALQA